MEDPRIIVDERVKILMVDDHEENLLALEAILSNSEYDLVKSTSATDALRCILRDEYAVILLDVMMPDMDGFELATMIRKREKNRETPIIFLTALAKDIRHIYHGYGVGAVDYIAKPLDPLVVSAKVRVFADLFRKSKKIERQSAIIVRNTQREREHQITRLKEQNERRYRHLAEAIPQIVWRASPKGQLQYFNKQGSEFGFDLDASKVHDFSWESFSDTFHPEDFAKFSSEWDHALNTFENIECQCRLKSSRSSQYRWQLCRAYPEFDGGQNIVAWLGTWTDIHDQKNAEHRQVFLAEASKALSSSLEYEATVKCVSKLLVPELADWCVVDLRDGQDFFRCAEIVHRDSEKSAMAQKLFELRAKSDFGGHDVSLALSSRSPVLMPHVPTSKLHEIAESDGQFQLLSDLGTGSLISVPIEIRGQFSGAITLVCGDSHRTFGAVDLELCVELARHAAMAIDNARLYKIAQESNHAKDEFLATVSHELRTPLSAVLGWTEMLMEYQHSDEVSHCIEIIKRNAHSLSSLVDDLLDISRIIAGKVPLNLQEVNLQSLVETAIESARPAATAKGIEIKCKIQDVFSTMKGDPARIQQIAWNLVSNAIKFTPPGGHVNVDLQGGVNDQLIIQVKDDGIGLKPEMIGRIFERFVQADGSISRATGGLGLGLAIVRYLVELHGGSVEAQSPGEGKGSTFIVRFPVNSKVHSDHKSAFRQNVVGATSAPSDQASLSGVRVLVVDDQQDSRALIARILNRSGAETRMAGSVKEALSLCGTAMPDIILTDIGMPEDDGFSLLRSLRELERTQNLPRRPVAAITAHVGKPIREKMIESGFDAYLEKPVVFDRLVKTVGFLANQARTDLAVFEYKSRSKQDLL